MRHGADVMLVLANDGSKFRYSCRCVLSTDQSASNTHASQLHATHTPAHMRNHTHSGTRLQAHTQALANMCTHVCMHTCTNFPTAYPDRLAVRAQRGGAGTQSVSFAMSGGANVRLFSDGDPLGQVSTLLGLCCCRHCMARNEQHAPGAALLAYMAQIATGCKRLVLYGPACLFCTGLPAWLHLIFMQQGLHCRNRQASVRRFLASPPSQPPPPPGGYIHAAILVS